MKFRNNEITHLVHKLKFKPKYNKQYLYKKLVVNMLHDTIAVFVSLGLFIATFFIPTENTESSKFFTLTEHSGLFGFYFGLFVVSFIGVFIYKGCFLKTFSKSDEFSMDKLSEKSKTTLSEKEKMLVQTYLKDFSNLHESEHEKSFTSMYLEIGESNLKKTLIKHDLFTTTIKDIFSSVLLFLFFPVLFFKKYWGFGFTLLNLIFFIIITNTLIHVAHVSKEYAEIFNNFAKNQKEFNVSSDETMNVTKNASTYYKDNKIDRIELHLPFSYKQLLSFDREVKPSTDAIKIALLLDLGVISNNMGYLSNAISKNPALGSNTEFLKEFERIKNIISLYEIPLYSANLTKAPHFNFIYLFDFYTSPSIMEKIFVSYKNLSEIQNLEDLKLFSEQFENQLKYIKTGKTEGECSDLILKTGIKFANDFCSFKE